MDGARARALRGSRRRCRRAPSEPRRTRAAARRRGRPQAPGATRSSGRPTCATRSSPRASSSRRSRPRSRGTGSTSSSRRAANGRAAALGGGGHRHVPLHARLPGRPGAVLHRARARAARRRARAVGRGQGAASEAILAGGGTITHHHAVGRDHRPWYDRQRPSRSPTALRAAKGALDPAGDPQPRRADRSLKGGERPPSASWPAPTGCCPGLAAAAAAAVAGRPARQRVGDRRRRRHRAGRHRDPRARLAAELERALDQAGLGSRTCGCSSARTPIRTTTGSPRRSWSGRLRALDAPEPRAHDEGGRGPRARARAPDRGRAPERRAARAARRYREERSGDRASASPRSSCRTASCCRASRSRPTSAPGRSTRRPGHAPSHVVLFQPERGLLLSGDHLLGRVSLYFDYGWTPDPAGEFLAASTWSTSWTCSSSCPATAARSRRARRTSRRTAARSHERIERLRAALADGPRTAFELVPEMLSDVELRSR